LRFPVALAWNTNATIEDEARTHEAAHAAAAHLVGFEVTQISMDARWADHGERGSVAIRSRPSEPSIEDHPLTSVSSIQAWLDAFDRQAEEHAFAHGVVVRAGGYVAGDWELGSSRGDRELLQAIRWPGWSPDAWEYLVTDKTQRLVRSQPFRLLHWRIVRALEEMGDLGVLSGPELREVLGAEDVDGGPGAPGRLRTLPTQVRP
jgi:hypothetical protein